jgi:hypothetical protein
MQDWREPHLPLEIQENTVAEVAEVGATMEAERCIQEIILPMAEKDLMPEAQAQQEQTECLISQQLPKVFMV